jgi:hypothetical protein
MRGGAEQRNNFIVQLLLSFVLISMFSSSSHLFLFRCSAPPLICSYFVVKLLLSFVLISMFSELNNEIRTDERRS